MQPARAIGSRKEISLTPSASRNGIQMDGITNPVAVNAVFKNGIRVVPRTRLILIKPSRQ